MSKLIYYDEEHDNRKMEPICIQYRRTFLVSQRVAWPAMELDGIVPYDRTP